MSKAEIVESTKVKQNSYFKVLKNLTKEDIIKLPTVDCVLERVKKINRKLYKIVAKFGSRYSLEFYLSELEYTLVKMQLNLPEETYLDNLILPTRLSTDTTENGMVFYVVDLFICKDLIKTILLRDVQVTLLETLKKKDLWPNAKYPFVKRDFAPEDLNTFNFEDLS